MDKRDPRKDPRPGDVTKADNDIMLVIRRTGESVYWAHSGQCSDYLFETPLEWWRRDSKNEEVLHVANE